MMRRPVLWGVSAVVASAAFLGATLHYMAGWSLGTTSKLVAAVAASLVSIFFLCKGSERVFTFRPEIAVTRVPEGRLFVFVGWTLAAFGLVLGSTPTLPLLAFQSALLSFGIAAFYYRRGYRTLGMNARIPPPRRLGLWLCAAGFLTVLFLPYGR